MKYDDYRYLIFERPCDGVLLITINRPERLNAANKQLHHELSVVWKTVDEDPSTRVAVITGRPSGVSGRCGQTLSVTNITTFIRSIRMVCLIPCSNEYADGAR